MTNLEKANEMLKKDPELMEKVSAEVERLANAKEAATPEEAMAKAIKTVLDIDVTEEELKGAKELNLDELDNVAGGSDPDSTGVKILETVMTPVFKAADGVGYIRRKIKNLFGIED